MLAGVHDIQRRSTHRQRFGHLIQVARALFAVAGDTSLITHASRQIPDHQPDGEHHTKGKNVLHIRHGKCPARGNKKQIETDDVNHRSQYRRPASVKERDHDHAQQVDHHQIGGIESDQPLAGNHRNQGAEHYGDQTAADLDAPFLAKGAGVRRTVWQGRWFIIQRDDHQIQIGRAAGQPVGKRFTAKPAAMLTTANDNLAQIMLTGVTQDGFIFRRIGERGSFGPQLLRQA